MIKLPRFIITHLILTGLMLSTMLLPGCFKRSTQPEKPVVFVSILPQKYFVEKIAGSHVDVAVMVEPGASPHSYEPKPFQMTGLSHAQAYFSIGIEFEKTWLPRFAALSPHMYIVHTDTLIPKIAGGHVCEEHSELIGNAKTVGAAGQQIPACSDEHNGVDPHIWLSPELAKQQAQTICRGLIHIDTAHAAEYTANCAQLLKEITALQATMRTILKPGTEFMVFHPSWAYFAQEFGLKQIAVEVDGKEPSPREMAAIFSLAQQYHITTVFAQPQFSQQSAQVIAHQLNGRVVPADDLAYNWADNLVSVAKAIAAQ
jgi:zinc transport system substrate-binding protein